jgi:hypothetical protein
MAVQLPRYQKQVKRSAESGVRPEDESLAGVEGRAMAKLGAQVGAIATSLGVDYFNRKAKNRAEGDLADAKAKTIENEQDLSSRVTDARNKGVPVKELYEKVVTPALEEYRADIDQRGYSNAAIDQIRNNHTVDAAKMGTSMAYEFEKMENHEISSKIARGMGAAIAGGDEEEANRLRGIYADMNGEDAAQDTLSSEYYNQGKLRIQSYGGLPFAEQVDALKGELETLDDSPMDTPHSQTLKIEINGKINRLNTAYANGINSTESWWYGKVDDGDVDDGVVAELYRRLPKEQADEYYKDYYKLGPKGAVGGTAVGAILSDYSLGKIGGEAAFKKLSKADDNSRALGFRLLTSMEGETLAGNPAITVSQNGTWKAKTTVPISGTVVALNTAVMRSIGRVGGATPSKEDLETASATYVDKMTLGVAWLDKHPGVGVDDKEFTDYLKTLTKSGYEAQVKELNPRAAPTPVPEPAPVAGEIERLMTDGRTAIFDESTKKFLRYK